VIDDAIVGLKDEEREAVVLRFFEKRSFGEIGEVLRVTEEAARKRVERALDKLRAILERRGVTSTAAALGVALTVIASASAPAALGAKVAGHAMATAGATGGGATLAGWLGLALPTAAVLVLGGFALGQRHANADLRGELGRFAADRAALASLKTENRELARKLVDVAALRTAAAQPLPALPRRAGATPPPARPIASTISITTAGTIQWEGDLVNLRDFTQRLKETKATADPESRVHVRIDGTSYSALTYVVDEARKAGIEHLTVEGGAKTDGKFSFWWP
jgi:biopolymer transport protein ExbD